MFLEYWMIGVAVAVVTFYMAHMYKQGFKAGHNKGTMTSIDVVLKVLSDQKIIAVKDDTIVPGDYDAFIKHNEGKES